MSDSKSNAARCRCGHARSYHWRDLWVYHMCKSRSCECESYEPESQP